MPDLIKRHGWMDGPIGGCGRMLARVLGFGACSMVVERHGGKP